MGSNNHPGDYRNSGCTACHVVYANDRSPTHSGWYSKYGNQGLSFTADKAIRKDERGHPITHQFTRAIPTAQCMTCHMHQGNLFVNPYLGYTWWDQETDGEFMYPKQQKNPTSAELVRAVRDNPEAAAARGLWGDLDFLEKVAELNPKLTNTQFADYHGHGWIFRAVFKHDREGNLRDRDEKIIAHDDPQKFAKAVHLKDEHLAHGMQCIDCHFDVDAHGNGLLYGEPRAATTIECIDCHGTITKRPTLITSGNGGIWNGTQVTNVDLRAGNTPSGPRFFWQGKKLFQRSMMSPDLVWEVPQTIDTIDPKSPQYNAKSAYAKTLRRDGKTWGNVPGVPLTPALSPGERENRSPSPGQTTAVSSSETSQASESTQQLSPLPGGEGQGEGKASPRFTLKNPRAVGVQFRYGFVTDDEGFKVVDLTDPTKPKLIPGAFVPLKNAQRFYLARTYAYVADGAEGLAFIDISNPEKPRLERLYNADGKLNDTRAVQIGSVNASEFALVADGSYGLQIIQMISPENVPEHMGFSPKPNPKWIARFPTKTPAVAVSRGLDRDRVVDESGNQTVVFGRRGSRPFNLAEMEKFYERDGELYTVENVFTHDGKPVTRSGEELKPATEFQSAEPEAASPPPDNERLERRGQ
jgi:LVIVD repeat